MSAKDIMAIVVGALCGCAAAIPAALAITALSLKLEMRQGFWGNLARRWLRR